MRRVVVTGLGIVSPLGNSAKETFDNAVKGVLGIGEITRFNTEGYKVKIAAEVKNFDPSSFMDKSEIRRADLFTQFALKAAKEAVEDAGDLKLDPSKIGVYFGSGIGGIATFSQEVNKLTAKGPDSVSPYFITMMISNIAAGQIAIKHNAQGCVLPVVTACASSTNTVGEAYRAIKHGYADAIIAGGSEAAITPIAIAGFTNCMALTKNNDIKRASIPFDKKRDGFVMGEGAGVLILEEYENAKKRGAKIYAEIKGYGNSCDAYHITAPREDGLCVAKAIRSAADEAMLKETDCIYINAHGTSTPLNDKSETLAVKKAFNGKAENILMSSTKSMTGHCLGAAGAIEAAISVLALENSIAPPTIGYEDFDPECDIDCVPNKAKKEEFDAVMSNSFGFGGHNASIVFTKI